MYIHTSVFVSFETTFYIFQYSTAPNAITYCSSRKRSNKRQQDHEDFQQQLLETLKSDGKDEEQDGTDLAMMAMVKKIKHNLSADQQEDLIDELQQVVSRFCREVK